MTRNASTGDDSRRVHDESAGAYDRSAREARWFPEVLFGLCFEYLRPGERLLALGVGTGLCIAPFAGFGLHVTGADNSPAMLDACRAKGLAECLTELDLRDLPWPWPAGHFDHVIASGVLHFLDELDGVLQESARMIGPGGVVAFTSKVSRDAPAPGRDAGRHTSEMLGGVPIFSHRRGYLDSVLSRCGLRVRKELQVSVGVDSHDRHDAYLVLVAEKRT